MTDKLPIPPERTKTGHFRARITKKIARLVEEMVHNALSRTEAAQRAGMTDDAARKALKRPHVKAYYNQAVADVRENAAQRAYLKIAKLSETGESERLQFDASRWVAGVDGIAPVQKVQGQHHHSHSFAGFEYPTIDVTPDKTSVGEGENDEE